MHSIACFGEVLWDLLPGGKVAGGAPMNVAYHLNNLGFESRMVSCVGDDALGRELLQFLRGKGVSTQWVQVSPDQPTGTVNVRLDEAGSPQYEIVQPVAWDHISQRDDVAEAVKTADALVFGSLACRSETSRQTLLALLERAPLRVFDINLREPFYSQELLELLLSKANIVKMNDVELDILSGWYGFGGDEEEQMHALRDYFSLKVLVVTKGGRGAACLSEQGLTEVPGIRIQVKDTIGAGDAFLAGFLYQYISGSAYRDCLRFANALGATVATRSGGTPAISLDEILDCKQEG
jgi:fructokinase